MWIVMDKYHPVSVIARCCHCYCALTRSLRQSITSETEHYTALDYIRVIVQTLNQNYLVRPYSLGNANTTYPISAFITHLIYLRGTAIPVDVDHITSLGVKCVAVHGYGDVQDIPKFDATSVREAIDEILHQTED